MASNFQAVAQQFTEFYYKCFDQERASLKALYRPQSMLTFESSAVQGTEAIIAKLEGLPFEKIEHRVDTLDAQPSNEQGGVLVLVTGALLIDEEKNPMSYTQTFQLMPEGGSFFVFNDVFKLIYPAA